MYYSRIEGNRRTRSMYLICSVFVFAVMCIMCMVLQPGADNYSARHQFTGLTPRTRATRSLLSWNSTTANYSTSSAPLRAKKDEYPDDIFSLEAKQRGAVLLHVIGLCYMFIALATVSDEYFIPTLEVIIEEFAVAEDVAGATFMAAGGSAPELFTSIIGVFIAHSNVGFGTIVGSAVFNVLFVIGACAVFSHDVLKLTWWPLFRDCFFYSVALLLLIGFFLNDRVGVTSRIYWWETTILIAFYFVYVLFMKFNGEIERYVKRYVKTRNRVENLDLSTLGGNSVKDRDLYIQKALEYMKTNRGECFRFGVLQLVMRTIDPLREDSVEDMVLEMESINKNSPRRDKRTAATVSTSLDELTLPNTNIVTETAEGSKYIPTSLASVSTIHQQTNEQSDRYYTEVVETVDGPPAPLDLSWPLGLKDRVVYVFRAPIIILLHFTLSDVRKPTKRGRYPWTFFVSILWIVVFSYFMVWWAKEISLTMGVDDETMGLTVLAAGTSIPDLITSVLVARKGYGDMAVSSSVGSNLFDVTIGLPLPWLIWSGINGGKAFVVTSSGLFCSTIMLFVMLLTVVTSIAICKWRMSKLFGILMLLLYLTFVVLSVLLQKGDIECPF